MGCGHGKHQGYGEVDQGKRGVKIVEGGGLHLLNVVPGNGVPVFEHVLSAGNAWRASVDGVHPAAFPAVFEFRQATDSAHVEPVLAALRANRKAGGAQGIVGSSALLEGGVGSARNTSVGSATGNGYRHRNGARSGGACSCTLGASVAGLLVGRDIVGGACFIAGAAWGAAFVFGAFALVARRVVAFVLGVAVLVGRFVRLALLRNVVAVVG